jgi:mevalonate kinase
MQVEATAPGKAIFYGEHSVVYRGPAIVAAIDRKASVIAERRPDNKIFVDANDLGFSGYFEDDVYYPVRGKAWRGRNLTALNVAAKVTMDKLDTGMGVNLKVRSMIPIAVGLGSSAAICVATVAAVGRLLGEDLSPQTVSDLAYEGERIIHGNPSGVDNNIASFGGVLRYERGKGIERFELGKALPFVIGNTRKKRSTGRMVERVRLLRERNPVIVDRIIDHIGDVAREGLESLISDDLDLRKIGDLMSINHGLLAAMDVSTYELDKLVHASKRGGALGAKLTGAGGGGCMIALAEERFLSGIERHIRRSRGESIRVKIVDEGVEAKVIQE